MNSDINWVKELIKVCESSTLEDVINWLGKVYETDVDHKNDPIYFLKPNNPRIERIVVNGENDKLSRVRLEGNEFFLSLEFLSSLAEGYKRAFNTYDPIYDEQYMFYPAKTEYPFIAVSSWIPEEEQKKRSENIKFKNVNIFFGKDQVPYRYRDGWILENRQ